MNNDKNKNEAVLFPANRSSERSPSFTGKAVIHGKEWYVALWKNVSKKRDVSLRLDFEEPWVWIDQVDSSKESKARN